MTARTQASCLSASILYHLGKDDIDHVVVAAQDLSEGHVPGVISKVSGKNI